MKTAHRYAFLFVILILYFVAVDFLQRSRRSSRPRPPSSFVNVDERPLSDVQRVAADGRCSMGNCFDFDRCRGKELKVFVYPEEVRLEGEQAASESYSKILTSIRQSSLFTSNASEACLFVLSIDTTDRDKISENYVREVPALLASLPDSIWNGGKNHIIFNLYHGTYPDYAAEHLGFDTGQAMVARASAASQSFRHGFDISLPLFHKEHPIRDSIERSLALRDVDPLLVSFKGKRYVYGIGSETRDSLHHLHHPLRSPMLTTCRHNHDWQAHQDERCQQDNEHYDKWDYDGLMANSTFCLAPRGRRLGSFRFLECLRAGSIPVVLSDDWQLPFHEILDWSSASIRVAESNVLLVNDLLASIPRQRIRRMREAGRVIYHRHFASVEKIALSTLRLAWRRVEMSQGERPPSPSSLLPFQTHFKGGPRPLVAVLFASPRESRNLQDTVQRAVDAFPRLSHVFVLWPSARGPVPQGADLGLPSGTSLSFLSVPDQWSIPLSSILESISSHLEGSAILFLSDRSNTDKESLLRLLEVFEERPWSVVSTEGVEYSPGSLSLSSSMPNVALLHSSILHSGYLRVALDLLPSSLVTSCPTASLAVAVASASLSPPLFLSSSPSFHRNLTSLQSCLDLIGTRFPLGIPLLSINLLLH